MLSETKHPAKLRVDHLIIKPSPGAASFVMLSATKHPARLRADHLTIKLSLASETRFFARAQNDNPYPPPLRSE